MENNITLLSIKCKGIKICSCCKNGFSLDQFYVDNSKNDGKRHICKKCDHARRRINYDNKMHNYAKTQLSDEETKQATLDFIFGKSEENPIKR